MCAAIKKTQQLLTELTTGQAVDEKVHWAVDDHEKPSNEVQEEGLLVDMIVFVVLVTEFNVVELSHLHEAEDEAGGVEDEEDEHEDHEHPC